MEQEVSRMSELYQLVITLGFFSFAVMAHLLKDVIFFRNGRLDWSEFLFYIILGSFLFLVIVEVVR